MDEDYKKNFVAEMRTARLIEIFSIFAIIIICLGVFGLSVFMTEHNSKEIGARKVLGASVVSIWQMLFKQFVIPLSVAFVIIAPLSYYFAQNWLNTYSYKTNFELWILVVSGFLILVIMILTLSFQTIKAATSNPIRAIRTELPPHK